MATFFNDVLEKILFTKAEEFNQADEKVKKNPTTEGINILVFFFIFVSGYLQAV